MDSQWHKDYIQLAFRIEKPFRALTNMPYVDFYYGPQEWKQAVQKEPEREPLALLHATMAARLLFSLQVEMGPKIATNPLDKRLSLGYNLITKGKYTNKGNSMTRLERRQREQQELKQQIVQAAREIARQEGWGNVTLRKIADKIEYSHAALYAYFESKDALLLEILREGFRLLITDMRAAMTITDDAEEALYKVGFAYWRFAQQNTELYQVMYGLNGVSFGVTETRGEGQQVGDVVGEVVRKWLLNHNKPVVDIEEKVYLLWSTVHGLIALTMAGRLPTDDRQREALVRQSISQALIAWSNETKKE